MTTILSCSVAGWSLGNELIGASGFNSSAYAVDYGYFVSALSGFSPPSVGQAVFGPSAAGFPGAEALAPFIQGAAHLLSGLTFHAYAFKNCSLPVYASKAGVERMSYYYSAYSSLRDALAPGLPLINEEAATQAGGGCEGLSDRFVSGFWWLHTLGLAASAGISRVHRQDVAGFSFNGRPSHYQLAGAAGWVNTSASGPLTPHPDWFATVLHKQLAGGAVLASSLDATPAVNASVAAHVWCAAAAARAPRGAVTVSFVNMGASPVTLELLSGPVSQPRVEFFIEAEGSIAGGAAISNADPGVTPPEWLTSDSALLNGAVLSVDSRGRLPAYPIPGRAVPAGAAAAVLPPWSYGFILLPEAGAPGCLG